MQEFRTGTPTAAEPRILRVNVAGQPVEWLHWQEAVGLYARDLVIWTLGDPVMKIRGLFPDSSGSDGPSAPQHHRVRWPHRSLAQSTPPLTNRALFRRDANICMYCGNTFLDKDLTRDHVVPSSKGGEDTWENVVAACRRCNHHKGNRLLADTSMELQALPYTPNFAEYLALINSGRILGDQMEFLAAQFGRDSRLRH